MRVRHSACSWLKEIVPLDSVAGNTLIGMFTRLIFRKPFQVARTAIVVTRKRSYRLHMATPTGTAPAGSGNADREGLRTMPRRVHHGHPGRGRCRRSESRA